MADDEQDPIKLLQKGFDDVVMGTGLTECILSGVLSIEGKKVLHIDRNKYYGGEGASLKLTQLYEKFLPGVEPNPAFGKDRDWNVDLIAKFLMAGGELANILRQMKQVQDNVQFQQIAGSYVYSSAGTGMFGSKPGIGKVPANAMEAATSGLVGMMEKGRLKKFLECVSSYKPDSGPIHQGINLDEEKMNSVYKKFSLEPATCDFVGHAMALYLDDEYLQRPARETFKRVYMYANSVAMYGKSPYIYPLYGLGELPSGFTRLSAVHGGTYMLDTEHLGFDYDDSGKVKGVKIKFENPKQDGERIELIVPTKRVIADPSYFPPGTKKTRATGQKVIRAICVLNHAIKQTHDADSAQIIIPQSQVNRKHDIYIAAVSSAHNVCPKGYWVAIVSTIVETDNPHHELGPAYDLLHPIEEKFVGTPVTLYEQADDASDNIFVSRSFDATSHFETCTDDVKDIYKRMHKKDLDVQAIAPKEPQE